MISLCRSTRSPRSCSSTISSNQQRRSQRRRVIADALPPRTRAAKAAFVEGLLDAKHKSGLSFEQLASKLAVTEVYAANLFYNQAQLKPDTAAKLKKAVPALSAEQLEVMQRAPMRMYEPSLEQEPHVYRLLEAVRHNGEAMKAVLNERLGDGIMSAIDFYLTTDVIEGKHGETRVVFTFNGKFLPHIEQRQEDLTI